MNFSNIWKGTGELGVILNLCTKFNVFLVSIFQKIWDCEEFAFHRQLNMIIIKATLKLSKQCITFILAILFNQTFNAQFYNLSYTYWLAMSIPMLHYSEIFYWPWLLTIYHQVTGLCLYPSGVWEDRTAIWWTPWGWCLVQWKALE